MRRISKPSDLTHTYQINAPSTHSRRFRLQRVETDGTMKGVQDERLDSINARLKAGSLTKGEARKLVELLREELYKADGVKVSRVEANNDNEKLVADYVAKVIRRRKTKDTSKESAEQALYRAVRALGEHSLLTSSMDVLQSSIDEKYPDQRQRQLVVSLNSLLRFAGRSERFEKHSKEARDVKYMPLEKLPPVLVRLPSDAWRVAVQMAAYTGLRIGELFALEARHLDRKEQTILVERQIDEDGKRVLPKRGKQRIASVFPETLALYDKWLRLKDKITIKERRKAARILRTACRRAYPNRPEWHLRFHDLRHSYAIALLDEGVDIQAIAYSLGDSVQVAQEYYLGTKQPMGMVRQIRERLSGRKKLRRTGS